MGLQCGDRPLEAVLIVRAIRDLTAGNCREVVEVASINTRSSRQEADESPTNYDERFLAFCSRLRCIYKTWHVW